MYSFYSWIEHLRVVFWHHNRGGRIFCSNHSGCSVKEKLHSEFPLSFYLQFIIEENRIKHRPHLLDGFSPILVFEDAYCVYLYVDGVLIFFFFHFCNSIIFINLSNKLVLTNMRSKEINPHNKIFQYYTIFVVTNLVVYRSILLSTWTKYYNSKSTPKKTFAQC